MLQAAAWLEPRDSNRRCRLTPYSGRIFKNSERITLVAGRNLSLINQGSAILAGTSISWNHVALDYYVPYCPASYSVAKNELTQRVNQ